MHTDESNNRSVEENYKCIEQHLQSIMDKHVPSKMTRTWPDLPWLSQELKKQSKRKQRLYNRAKKTGKQEDKRRYKDSQKTTKKAIEQAHWRYLNNIL